VHLKSSKNIQENPNPKNAMNKPKAKQKKASSRQDRGSNLPWGVRVMEQLPFPDCDFFAFIICRERN